MMIEQERIERFLQLQEQAGQMTDEELQQALDDPQLRELAEQMAFAKRAFKNEELKAEEPDVDQEWEKFLTQQLPTPVRGGVAKGRGGVKAAGEATDPTPALPLEGRGVAALEVSLEGRGVAAHRWMKIAASFIGVLLVSGIAFAAIHIWSLTSKPSPKSEGNSYIQTSDTIKHSTPLSNRREGGDEAAVVFDNVPLDTMLADMTAYYGAEAVFKNDATRQLRFHFVWKREDGLSRAVEKLNRFESLNIRLEDNKIIVE